MPELNSDSSSTTAAHDAALQQALAELEQTTELMAADALSTTHFSNDDILRYLAYLRLLWSEFHIYIVEPFPVATEKNKNAEIITLENGRKIHDHGFVLSTSAGADYASYTQSKLYTTIQAMVALLVQRHVTQVSVAAVNADAMRVAWIECVEHQIEIVNFEPNDWDFKVRERQRLIKEKARKLKAGQELRL